MKSIVISENIALRILNLSMRGLTLFSKFLLIFVLAKFLDPKDVGLYGLLAGTVSYGLMALGFDFYAYSIREIIVVNRDDCAALLRDQAVFFGFSYIVILPFFGFVFFYNFLPRHLIFLFYLLLVFEHIAQEVNRLLVALSEPLWASAVLFVRSGFWAIVVALWLCVLPDQRNLEFVLAAWIIGVVMACILGCSRLRKLVPGPVSKPINWSWIRCGVRVGASFILGSLSLRAFYTIDRYWVEALGGLEVLAAYSLFMGIGNAIAAFLDAAVYSFSYPGIVSAVADGDESKFKNNIIRLLLHTVSFSLVLSFAAIVLAQPVIGALGRDIYSHYFCFLYWIVFSNVLFAISMTPHYALYAKGKDGAIVLTHVCSLLFFLLLVIAMDGWLGVYAVPVSVTLSFMFLLFVKSVLFFRLFPTKCLGCYG